MNTLLNRGWTEWSCTPFACCGAPTGFAVTGAVLCGSSPVELVVCGIYEIVLIERVSRGFWSCEESRVHQNPLSFARLAIRRTGFLSPAHRYYSGTWLIILPNDGRD